MIASVTLTGSAGHVAPLAMTSVVRNKWPLYVITQNFSSRLPTQLEKLVLVTSSFAFARLACCCLGRSFQSWFDILRVTHCSRCFPVGQQSSDFVARLDQHWSKPPGVLAEAYCQLCVKSYCSDSHEEVKWLLNGVNVFTGPTIGRGERPVDAFPVNSYEQLGLNTLNKHWPGARSAAARAALRSAKLAWTGPLFFARALRDQLPPEIMDRVVEFATSYQQLSSAPSKVRQYCPLIKTARRRTVSSKVQNIPDRKRGKKRCKQQTKT